MKAAVVDTDRRLIVQSVPFPKLPEGGAVVKVTGCSLCGSDLDKLRHRTLPAGTVLGHEVVGKIETLSSQAKQSHPALFEGQRVSVAHHVPCQTCHYCRHGSPSMCRAFKNSNIFPGGFSQYIAVSAEHLKHTIFALPKDISDSTGTCIEPLACVIRAVDRLPQSSGNDVLVIGLGFIGLLAAQYLKHENYKVYGVDLNPDRVHLAEQLDTTNHYSIDSKEVLAELLPQSEGRGADTVFLSVVNPHTLQLALQAVRDGGTLMLFSAYGKTEALLDQNELYFRELTIMTSYSPSLQHLQKAYDLIVTHRIETEPMVTHCYALENLAEAVSGYQDGHILKAFIAL